MSVPASGAGTTPAGKPLPVALEFAVDRMLKRQMLTAWEKWQQTCVRRSEVCQQDGRRSHQEGAVQIGTCPMPLTAPMPRAGMSCYETDLLFLPDSPGRPPEQTSSQWSSGTAVDYGVSCVASFVGGSCLQVD